MLIEGMGWGGEWRTAEGSGERVTKEAERNGRGEDEPDEGYDEGKKLACG